MQLGVSVRELMDRGLWIAACELTGINSWAVNEGLMETHEMVVLTDAQARQLGLLPPLAERAQDALTAAKERRSRAVSVVAEAIRLHGDDAITDEMAEEIAFSYAAVRDLQSTQE